MVGSILGALLIFVLRVTDVSLGTLRVLYMVQGRMLVAAALGFLEAGIFIVAISRVFQHIDNPLNMLGYAAGFAVGTATGVTFEGLIASGFILIRIISRERSHQMPPVLRERGFGLTAVRGEGRDGERLVLFLVAPRRRGREALDVVRSIDPEAFVTVESVSRPIGGYLPTAVAPTAVRK